MDSGDWSNLPLVGEFLGQDWITPQRRGNALTSERVTLARSELSVHGAGRTGAVL